MRYRDYMGLITLLVENNEPGLRAVIRFKTKLNTMLIGSRTQDEV